MQTNMSVTSMGPLRSVAAGDLHVAYHHLAPKGASARAKVILLHGFPYDVQSYQQVAPQLAQQGFSVVVPYLRGYGATRFKDGQTLRSGEQAVLGNDLLALMNALNIDRAIVAGYDWGGRAACIVAALWPERVQGLVTCGGYNIQNIAASGKPAAAVDEYKYWYQYYFHHERGRRGLTENRTDICRLLWQLWSPKWQFTDAEFERSAASFENPDFVDVVIHSYRHRYALVAGDPGVADIERRLALRPAITVPTVIIDGDADGVMSSNGYGAGDNMFTGACDHRVFPNIGHNPPQEAPDDFAAALATLL